LLRATASQQQLESLVSRDCICNHIHNIANVAWPNEIHFSCKLFQKWICAKRGIAWTSAP